MGPIVRAAIRATGKGLKKWLVGNLDDTQMHIVFRCRRPSTKQLYDMTKIEVPDSVVRAVLAWTEDADQDFMRLLLPALMKYNQKPRIVLVSENVNDPNKTDSFSLGTILTRFVYRQLVGMAEPPDESCEIDDDEDD